MNVPRLTKKRRRQLEQLRRSSGKAPPPEPDELTTDQRALLRELNLFLQRGREDASTGEIADALQWTEVHALEVLSQLRALGLIAHGLDGPGRRPSPELLQALKAYGLWDGEEQATTAELDALVLIEQGARRLPPPERAGFMIGCGLQELREQGHSTQAIRDLVNRFLDEGDRVWALEQREAKAPN